ncbi:OsmC-like protein protein [Deinococcus geothermalis DSM 11300]|uniref:OsmC-like protein protein n=1 Tax=Deinococcus geothermalis (strain DSM 11300 / CIP 105573 / AG-3a) TaxID=319795 RepID=Q1J106_DEIGD|nr:MULTISPECIES: OsmC family protein [Deinococcus]ABF44828.1 OsmC-like protein protein [Deinococcus geothermalis DSM 11300]MBI0446246.1 OsmC family peroxiredoxin [Deinococcus sp. DB0503]TDE87110.1 OsmC family peroxiredoxin [Deinococcus sp. S9]
MADIARKASAQWRGDLRSGQGTIRTESGVLKDAQYSFKTRFENGAGTNPEELLAAAHAGCFTMQLSALLAADGHDPQDLRTEATCEMVREGQGFKVSAMRLVVRGRVGNIDQAEFERHVQQAAQMCPLSRVMQGNVEITHEAVLE